MCGIPRQLISGRKPAHYHGYCDTDTINWEENSHIETGYMIDRRCTGQDSDNVIMDGAVVGESINLRRHTAKKL